MSVDLAIAASARDWPDRLHRYVLDHGGARIVGRLMGASQCMDSVFDVIFVDDVCSFLSPRLVTLLRQEGRAVIGVYEAEDSADAKRRLLECGISDVIESDATPIEFLTCAESAVADMSPFTTGPDRATVTARSVAVVGVSDGVGATEIAVSLATGVSRSTLTTLVDLDPAWPSVAQRLDLAPHPNLRTVVDVTLHSGDFDAAFQVVNGLRVVGGSGGPGVGGTIPDHEISMVLGALADRNQVLVADLGALDRTSSAVAQGFDAVILVASWDPVGLARMLRARDRLLEAVDGDRVLVAINKVPGRRFYKSEIRAEVSASLEGDPFVLLPFDGGLAECAWEGRPQTRGAFVRESNRIAGLVTGSVS